MDNQVKQDIKTTLSNQEIEPIGVYDFRLRQAHTADIPKFRGLSGQLTINPDDKNRLSVWKGTELGQKEDVPFISDLQDGSIAARFKYVDENIVRADISTETYVIDPTVSHRFFFNVNTPNILFKFADTFDKQSCLTITLYLTNIKEGTKYTFDTTQVDWLGDVSKLDSSIGALNIVTLSFNGTRWVAYSLDRTINDRYTLRSVNEAIVSNSRLLGWFLPQGSTNGEISDKYASKTSIPDLSDEDLNNIARVSASIYDVIDVSAGLEDIHIIEDYLEVIKKCANSIDNINAVVPHIYTLAWINSHIEIMTAIQENKDNINIVGSNIKSVNTVADNIDIIKNLNTNLPAITLVNSYKDAVINLSANTDSIQALNDNLDAIKTINTNIEYVNTVAGSINNVNTTATNIDVINNLGLSIDNVNAVYKALPQIINTVNNMDNITNIGNYINKGIMLRTELKDSLTNLYESTDANKLYLVPASMTESI